MKGPAIDQLVYDCMFPKPKPSDPQNFQGLLSRQLVPEVRLETQAFYGHLSNQEAKYPGLDYSYQPHRVRLSRYPWHRRLFRAMDNLGLTNSEIAGLTKWEGTRWAKERYEREQGIVIRDTTADCIADWVEPELRVAGTPQADPYGMEEIQDGGDEEDNDMEDMEDSDTEIQSVGVELNERLRAEAAAREAGFPATVMDPEWEEYLKEAAEAGTLPLSPDAHIPGTRPVPEHLRMSSGERIHHLQRQFLAMGERRQESQSTGSSSSESPHYYPRPSLTPHGRAITTGTALDPNAAATFMIDTLSRRPVPETTSQTHRASIGLITRSRQQDSNA
jgi:hypothetical protein